MCSVDSVMSACNPMDCSPLCSSPWDSLGKNSGVGGHALPLGNLPNPGIKPALQVNSLSLSHRGNPRKVATDFKKSNMCSILNNTTYACF